LLPFAKTKGSRAASAKALLLIQDFLGWTSGSQAGSRAFTSLTKGSRAAGAKALLSIQDVLGWTGGSQAGSRAFTSLTEGSRAASAKALLLIMDHRQDQELSRRFAARVTFVAAKVTKTASRRTHADAAHRSPALLA
jgi:hypothetical protein